MEEPEGLKELNKTAMWVCKYGWGYINMGGTGITSIWVELGLHQYGWGYINMGGTGITSIWVELGLHQYG